jgi:protein TonB
MLAYAANRPVVVDRRPHPNAMLFIVGAHVAVAAAVMSAKMDLPRIIREPPLIIDTIEPPPAPPPPATQQRRTTQTPQQNSRDTVDHPPPQVRTDQGSRNLDTGGVDTGIKQPPIELPPIENPPAKQIRPTSGAQLLTPPSELKPPYPPSKLLNEEEAALQLRLTIDEHGRVIAVDAVGRADPVFLAAARRHLLAHWRYKPAVEDGRAVASSMVITLRFELDG